MGWHLSAGIAIGFSIIYLHWRWTASLNPDALFFSVLVAGAETLFAIGTTLFFYDIWQEGDTPKATSPATRKEAALQDGTELQHILIDIFITTYDEPCHIVAETIRAAKQVRVPKGNKVQIYVLDDGNRAAMATLCQADDVAYLSRSTNTGFKAGNLRNGLFHSDGDFVLICDADTLLLPSFLNNTMGYFRDKRVAWVQTPHWFYDIPEGTSLIRILHRIWPQCPRPLRRIVWRSIGRLRLSGDPFLSSPTIFFDVIQRRRNRNNASFCCGAASIHRREAVFKVAISEKCIAQTQLHKKLRLTQSLSAVAPTLQPYRFHVSEDLYTSIDMHAAPNSWRSVFHPQVEAKMLSPRSLEAFCTQRLKYAGGSIDLMLRDPAIFRPHMPLRHRLHYAATFYASLSILWAPILLLAPAYSLLTATAPVSTYSIAFFLHFLPMLLSHELAMLIACKGHSLTNGRYLSVAILPLQLRAFAMVLRGKRPQFPPTPKTEGAGREMLFARPSFVLAGLLLIAGLYGALQWAREVDGYSGGFLIINLFWLGWNTMMLLRLPMAALLHFASRKRPPSPSSESSRRSARYDAVSQ
jgi:cellulose synthase (UDP-forming)